MKLPTPLYVLNEGLAFLLELAAFALLGWWGWESAEAWAPRLLLAVGAPAAAIVLWGLFAAPKARVRLPPVGVLAVKALVFGAAAVALHGLGRHDGAVVLAVVAVVNTALATVDRRARAAA